MTSLQLQNVISASRGLNPYTPVFLAFLWQRQYCYASTGGKTRAVIAMKVAASGSSNEIAKKKSHLTRLFIT
jgi:hypothetical protein